MKIALTALLALVIGSTAADAQLYAGPLVSGERVRVTAPEVTAAPIRGTFLSAERDTIRVATTGGNLIVGVPYSAVQRLEVSRGRNRVRWALMGAGAGAVAGMLLGAMSASGGSGSINESWAPLGGLLAGIPIGAVVGAILAPERWRDHPVTLVR
ncbi:MAG TPA: hypothetical protein VFT96_04625 [Gemmatimonadaceae bacterium]|nr:hypothetical protein [Gemmatimonadaceae bacterium]